MSNKLSSKELESIFILKNCIHLFKLLSRHDVYDLLFLQSRKFPKLIFCILQNIGKNQKNNLLSYNSNMMMSFYLVICNEPFLPRTFFLVQISCLVYLLSHCNRRIFRKDGSPGYDDVDDSFIKILCPHIHPYLMNIFKLSS